MAAAHGIKVSVVAPVGGKRVAMVRLAHLVRVIMMMSNKALKDKGSPPNTQKGSEINDR